MQQIGKYYKNTKKTIIKTDKTIKKTVILFIYFLFVTNSYAQKVVDYFKKGDNSFVFYTDNKVGHTHLIKLYTFISKTDSVFVGDMQGYYNKTNKSFIKNGKLRVSNSNGKFKTIFL